MYVLEVKLDRGCGLVKTDLYFYTENELFGKHCSQGTRQKL